MTKLRAYTTTALISSALLLSACGGGGGGGNGDGPNGGTTTPPIEGITYETMATQLDMNEGQDKQFAHVNDVDGALYDRGHVRAVPRDEGEDSVHYFRINFNDGNSPGDTTNNNYYIGAYDNDPNKQVVVDYYKKDGSTTTAGDHDFVKASYQNRDAEGWNTESYVYVPADGKGHVAMAAMAGEATQYYGAKVGIFGQKTTAAELQNQVTSQAGQVRYSGRSYGYVGNDGNRYGGYQGATNATVDFNAAAAPTFDVTSDMASDIHANTNMSYRIRGTIDANGDMVASRSNSEFDGATPTGISVNGSLFGPEARSMGYAYTIEGDQLPNENGNLTMTGGAVLNQTTP